MPRNRNSSDKIIWSSILEVCLSKDASKQKRCMAILLRLLPTIQKKEFERRMRQLYATDSMEGPEAVAWGLRMMATKCEPGEQRIFFLNQMDIARDDAATMRRIRKGWLQYNVTDPWWVVHHTESKQLPRYNSEPILAKSIISVKPPL